SKPISNNKSGQPQQGRPKNSRDKQKRKEKRFTPRNKAVLEIWANHVQNAIAEFLNPHILDLYDKKNMRSLTAEQMNNSEKLKFGVLCNLEPLGEVGQETILQALNKGGILPQIDQKYKEWRTEISSAIDRKLTLDELKHIQSCVYASYIKEE
ncbi:hypothetical protein LCGC14_2590540, partial [marine sediment metagenome]